MGGELNMLIQLRHVKHWLYQWRPVGCSKWYFINRDRILHPINEDARNLFTAAIEGLTVLVEAIYSGKFLRLKP